MELNQRIVPQLTFAIVLGAVPSVALAQFDSLAPEPLGKLKGALFLHGGGPVTAEMRGTFVDLAGGEKARIIVIPAADADNPLDDRDLQIWRKSGVQHVERLQLDPRTVPPDAQIISRLSTATGVWISGGKQSRLAKLYVGTPVETALQQVVRRGGVVGGTSAGMAITTRTMLVRDELRQGLDLLPGAIVDQRFLVRKRETRLQRAVALQPHLVGLGIDERTALVVRGRRLEVVGDSTVTIHLAGSAQRPARTERLSAGEFADLIALSRAATARQQPRFPTESPPPPNVEQGTLFILGGGKIPKGVLASFIEAAGGPDAPIVFVPCEEQENISEEPQFVVALRKAGAKQVTWLHTKDRQRANHDEKFLEPLRTAGGVWFGGGRQWNLVDSYQNTEAHRLMHAVLARGGAVGGSSAGASIQGDYMPRGDPLGNRVMMAEGYERGLGFLTGVAIDQHFSQRKRFGDMSKLVTEFPQLLGIGIDEGTALVVRKNIAEVTGSGSVAFYNARRRRDAADVGPDYITVKSAERFDLMSREVVPEE